MKSLSIIPLLGEFVYFVVRATWVLIPTLRKPLELVRILYGVLLGAIPLGLIAGICLGAVIWMQTSAILRRTGSDSLLPTVLTISVLLELAPLCAGLIIAARTGASLAAELGAMRQGEQVDALILMGLSPEKILVGPRVWACILALPIIHIFIALIAISSGYVAENLVSSTTRLRYFEASIKELRSANMFNQVIAAWLKTFVFGYCVGIAGCFHGLRASGGTEGLGKATTSGVVWACLLVLLADAVAVAVIQTLLI